MSFNDHAYWWVKSMIKTKKKWLPTTLLSSWGNVRLRPFQTHSLLSKVSFGLRFKGEGAVSSLFRSRATTPLTQIRSWHDRAAVASTWPATRPLRDVKATSPSHTSPCPPGSACPSRPHLSEVYRGRQIWRRPCPLKARTGGNFVWLNLFYWS